MPMRRARSLSLQSVTKSVTSLLLGIAVALGSYRGQFRSVRPLPWWLDLLGLIATLEITFLVVASLLVIRACGYRLVRSSG